ncbi:trichohyalin-like [Orbicella faveolata]|uniref:trichohyalin-like n=1 Tax=Orbicella faveolata TaxID=48498 RepID=UPI0009E58C88|nr:trichohyalin-like [Orbicella faveolata]
MKISNGSEFTKAFAALYANKAGCSCSDNARFLLTAIKIMYLSFVKNTYYNGGELVRKIRKTNSVNSADVLTAAGESSQTDPTAFIEQQHQIFNEIRLSREKGQQEENWQRPLSEMEERVKRLEEQLREKDRELENSERLSSEREQHLTNIQRQLREKELQEASLHEQLREKDQQEQNSKKQLRAIQQQLKEKDEQEENLLREMVQLLRDKDEQRENFQDRLREMEQWLREGEDQKDNLQRQLREMEQELTNLQGQFRDKEGETANLQEQVTTQERQLRVKDQHVSELEITLSTAQQALSEHQRRRVTPDWVISRDQIQLTDKFLGKGGWGSVVEGKYCGCSVAVKPHYLYNCLKLSTFFV